MVNRPPPFTVPKRLHEARKPNEMKGSGLFCVRNSAERAMESREFEMNDSFSSPTEGLSA